MIEKMCFFDDCQNKIKARKLCDKHYRRKWLNNEFKDNPLKEKHGMASSPEYKVWEGMLARCFNKNNTKYHCYGGKGITVCDRWKNSFSNFLEDVGNKKQGFRLNRIDKNGNYQRTNCEWVDPKLYIKKEKKITKKNERHGMAKSSEYRSWHGMICRCYNKKNKGYHRYGGRGITVCDRWKNSFNNFIDDMGLKPKGFQIDRINNDGNYELSNCRWVDVKTNIRNSTAAKLVESEVLEIRKSKLKASELSVIYNISKRQIYCIRSNFSWKDV